MFCAYIFLCSLSLSVALVLVHSPSIYKYNTCTSNNLLEEEEEEYYYYYYYYYDACRMRLYAEGLFTPPFTFFHQFLTASRNLNVIFRPSPIVFHIKSASYNTAFSQFSLHHHHHHHHHHHIINNIGQV